MYRNDSPGRGPSDVIAISSPTCASPPVLPVALRPSARQARLYCHWGQHWQSGPQGGPELFQQQSLPPPLPPPPRGQRSPAESWGPQSMGPGQRTTGLLRSTMAAPRKRTARKRDAQYCCQVRRPAAATAAATVQPSSPSRPANFAAPMSKNHQLASLSVAGRLQLRPYRRQSLQAARQQEQHWRVQLAGLRLLLQRLRRQRVPRQLVQQV